MSSSVSYALKSIKVGDIPDDGTMSTMLNAIGKTYKGTASLKEDKPTVFDVDNEEDDDPEFVFNKRGKKTVAFALYDYSPETLVQVKGGEVVDGAWEEPIDTPLIEKSIQIISKTNVLIEIPRASMSAIFNADFKVDGVALLDVEARPLRPSGLGVKSVKITKYLPPVITAGNAQNIAVNHADLLGVVAPFRGVVTSKLWEVVSFPVGAVVVLATPAAIGTAATGLTINGVYKFKLTAADSNDFENNATVIVTVAGLV